MEKFYNKTIRFEKWRECARCGFDYPYSALSKDPINGAIVCDACKDELGHAEYRARMSLPSEARTEVPGEP